MRGRRPKPNAMKLADGNPGRRKLNAEPAFGGGPVLCPDYFNHGERAAWGEIIAEIEHTPGLVQRVDQAALEVLAVSIAEYRLCCDELKTAPRYYETSNGSLAPHPALVRRDKAASAIKSFATEFGFTPSARSRVVMPGADRDELDEFVQKRA